MKCGSYTLAVVGSRQVKRDEERVKTHGEETVLEGKANYARSAMCRRCFTEPGWNAHEPSEIDIDDFQSNRSLDESYRTFFTWTLRAHEAGFYHDGRFATLLDVVNHYHSFKRPNLTEQEKNDLVQFLKSL